MIRGDNMTERLQKLIDTAEERKVGDFDMFMILSAGIYDGTFGKNGYDNLLTLGYVHSENKWYKITDYGDVFRVITANMSFHLDIPSEYGIPRFDFDTPVHVDTRYNLSTIRGQLAKEG